MTGHLTIGIGPAQAGTRVHTLQVPTLPGGGTVGVDHTLRPAGHVGIAKVFRYTLAGGGPVALGAPSVGATRRRVARVDDLRGRRN